MAVEIRLLDAAFGAGQPFEGMPKNKVYMQFGTCKDWPVFMGTKKNPNYTERHPGTFELRVGINPASVPTEIWNLMYNFMPNHVITSVAEAVRAGLVLLQKDGVTKTADEILTNA